MDISVIVVTYNSASCIRSCLASVFAQTGVTFECIVVDNASADDTVAVVNEFAVRLFANRENIGYGRANNQGFEPSRGRYIYLLNPDARLEGSDAFSKLCRIMDTNPQWGMAGTSIRSAADSLKSSPSTEYPGQRQIRRDFSSLPGKVAWIVGASMVVRRELYEKLGGFDPSFFLYSEETDFCLRMREGGFEIGHVVEVVVEHIGGASEDTQDPYEVSVRKLRGLLLFRQKHYDPDDCVFLAKRDLRRARFRMVWNGLLAKWQPLRSKAWQKHRQYRGIWEVSRQYLSSPSRKNS
jgi:GT2 family glycosyltransferase